MGDAATEGLKFSCSSRSRLSPCCYSFILILSISPTFMPLFRARATFSSVVILSTSASAALGLP